jgi:hypothetical protein
MGFSVGIFVHKWNGILRERFGVQAFSDFFHDPTYEGMNSWYMRIK